MGLYGDKSDYQELVKKNISRAKILYGLSEEDSKEVIKLLNEKDKIIEENGFWANFKLKILLEFYLIKYEKITELNFKLLCFKVPSTVVNKSSSISSNLPFRIFS